MKIKSEKQIVRVGDKLYSNRSAKIESSRYKIQLRDTKIELTETKALLDYANAEISELKEKLSGISNIKLEMRIKFQRAPRLN